jgi:hypothetical protein
MGMQRHYGRSAPWSAQIREKREERVVSGGSDLKSNLLISKPVLRDQSIESRHLFFSTV